MSACRQSRCTYSRSSHIVPLIVLLLILGVCAATMAAPVRTEIVGPRMMTVRGPDGMLKTVPDVAASGRILVQLRPQTTAEQFAALLTKHSAQVLRAYPQYNQYLVSLPAGMSVNDGRALWRAEAAVALAEPDTVVYALLIPNDPMYASQYQWNRVDAPAAWDIQQGLATTTIAIVDSGYDPDHEDLVAKWWQNAAEAAGTPGVDDDGNGYVDDINGWDFFQDDNDPDAGPVGAEPYVPNAVRHGTHCAGLVGAASDNAIGVTGHDWGARVMPVRALGPEGWGFTSQITAGMAYAVNNGADVISLSLGGGYNPMYDAPVAQAHAAGVVVVAAAGNESWVFTDDPFTWDSPVCNDGPNLGVDNFVLGVAATDSNDVIADFTNRDASSYKFVDVCAPGVGVLSTFYFDPAIAGLDQLYGQMSGTSMACPIAAGLCGLVCAQYPSFTPDEVINQVRATCDNIDLVNPLYAGTLGQGRINSAGAVGVDVPPDPVTNLQAFDTPLDEGGSITVTWKLSTDDGDDVVAYNLMRAQEDINNPGNPGPMSLLATLPPGTNNYIDAPVTDLVNFWYQVITRDAINAVASQVAGPAAARDDLSPPAVDTLVAGDTQADSGGSMSLSWYGYDYPSDLVEYRIYRAETTFTNVSAMTPIGSVFSPAVQNYADKTVTDNTPYWYAVTGVDDYDNEDTQVTAVGPVVSNPNLTFNYPPGLSIMAIGALPATAQSRGLADILGIDGNPNVDLAYYEGTDPANPYVIFSDNPNDPGFNQALGRAWWIKTDHAILINISGQPVPPGDFQLPVSSGWTLLGNPFSTALDFTITQVTGIGQGTPVSLQTSNELGFTRDYAWGFDSFTNSYVLISGANLDFATKELGPGRGAFFMARRPATLVLKRPVAAAANSPQQRQPLDGWMVKIVAEAGGAADIDNYLGVTSQAARLNGIVTPPRPDADLDLYFVRPAGEQARWATDFVTEAENRGEWSMRVACSTPGATVRLSWPDLSSLPADCRPILVDEATGRSIYLRTSTGYSYEVPDQAGERAFTLKLNGGAGALAVTALSVGAGGAGAQVAYTLSADASVDIEVLNIAGVVVRRVLADRVQAAGPQQVVWDGHNAAGVAVPSGTYLVRIVARAGDGQQVSAVRTLQIRR